MAIRDVPLYLVHVTPASVWPSIQKDGYLRTSPFSTHQFPGVYTTLVTKNTRDQIDLFEDDDVPSVRLILSLDVLNHIPFHFNPTDHNGFLTANTAFPWNFTQAIQSLVPLNAIYKKKCKRLVGTNELVLHRKVSTKFIVQTMTRGNTLPSKVFGSFTHDGENAKVTNYTFYFDKLKYTGIRCPIVTGSLTKPQLKGWSPLQWYKSLAAIVIGRTATKKKSLKELERAMIAEILRFPKPLFLRLFKVVQDRLCSVTETYLKYDLSKDFPPIHALDLLDRHQATTNITVNLPHSKTDTVTILKGKFYYTYPDSKRPLVGWHGSYDPPKDMDGNIFLPNVIASGRTR